MKVVNVQNVPEINNFGDVNLWSQFFQFFDYGIRGGGSQIY